MANLDLNDINDFNALTLGTAAGVAQALALFGKKPEEWDILEGSYNGVLFHVFQSKSLYSAAVPKIVDKGGRRKTRFMYPYKDGQTTDDLGRKPQVFDIEVLLFGSKYSSGMKALLNELDKPTPGDLIHPIRGSLKVAPFDYELLHQHDQRQAVSMKLSFEEHNFTIGDIRELQDDSVKGFLAKALEAFSAIDAAITTITGNLAFATSLKNQITQGLEEFKDRFAINLTNQNKSFNNSGSDDIPGLLPVNQGGTRNADGTLADDNFPLAVSPSDKFAGIPVSAAVEEALSVQQLTKDVISIRQFLSAQIELIKRGANGQGGLIFYNEILDLKKSGVLLQDCLEAGIASSQARIVQYTTKREMSLREVAFANGLSPNRVGELYLLNPELASINSIGKGTTLEVPSA